MWMQQGKRLAAQRNHQETMSSGQVFSVCWQLATCVPPGAGDCHSPIQLKQAAGSSNSNSIVISAVQAR
ncbi:unnamed protein product [Ceratitis capitata]|uniref:(Mediterranean fruit fly) hypothetical protein n=1 Tax=Ceratitis capitata TaxID=7213 RepID=A0A811V0S7_CERCA|nr:unnamed protein product [Ceratitis capitata]